MTDQEFLNILKGLRMGATLKLATDQYSRFDAENNQVIVEFKKLSKDHPQNLLEGHKIINNFRIAELSKRDFYVICMGVEWIQVYNISLLIKKDKLTFKCEEGWTSNNSDKKKFQRLVTYIPIALAERSISIKSQKHYIR